MSERISKTQRWLDLIAYLLGRRLPVAVEEIMEAGPSYAAAMAGGDEKASASTRRMFERDKDELRASGIPLKKQWNTPSTVWSSSATHYRAATSISRT
jgi:proteasome accessory factor B